MKKLNVLFILSGLLGACTLSAAESSLKLETPSPLSLGLSNVSKSRSAATQAVDRTVDANVGTKWCVHHGGIPVVWQMVYEQASSTPLQGYSFTSAGDVPTRDPIEWRLEGSNDEGSNWLLLDEKNLGTPFERRRMTKRFTVDTKQSFKAYRFVFKPHDSSHFQVAEIELEFAKDSSMEQKPNILFIFADDLSFETLSYLGKTEAKTPNLDKLVEEGVHFTHSYNMGAWTGAVCAASRAMLNSGVYVNRAEKAIGSNPHWSELMQDAGYTTYMTGKWHVGGKPRFDVVKDARGGMPKGSGYNRPKDLDDYENGWKPWDKSEGGFWEGGIHWSEVVANNTFEFLDQAKEDDKPFFMYIAFNATHDPRQSPKEYIDMYPLDSISVPENYLAEYPYRNDIGCPAGLRDEQLAPFPRTEFAIKVHRQEYFAILTHMDDQIGRILDALEESGEADNTYIIFTADHGLSVGHHGLLGKQNMYDHSMRVPFMITGPGVKKGQKIDQPIYLQDAMATSLALAGAKTPDYVEFQDLMPIIKGQKKTNVKRVYGKYIDLQRMIIQDEWKLIMYPRAERTARLYNLEKDPEEMVDLSIYPEYASKIAALKAEFKTLQVEMGDSLDVDKPHDSSHFQVAEIELEFAQDSASLGPLSALSPSAAESSLKLEYDRPSRTWDEYLPVGNGLMGAMVSGRPDMEHLQLNEMTLWSGGPNPVDKTAVVGSPEIFQKGHQLFREGQIDEAQKVLNKVMGLRGNRSYEALGDLKLAFTHSLSNAKNYRRELDLNDAMVRISYEDRGATFTREVFASYPDRAIVVRLTANKKNKISFEAKLDRERGASTQSIGSDTLVMRGQTAADGLTFESRVRIVNTGGTVKADANLIRVSDADEVLIFIVAGTNYKDPYSLGEDPAVACEESLSSVSAKTWDELKQRHLNDYQALFNRVTLDLGGEEKAAKPISERLAAMQEWAKTYKASGYQDGAVSPDPQLISLLFQYGRYILISCSREGAVPANLQGIWSEDITNPAWSSSYTLDINLEQNYWPSDVANLSECAEPLYQFIEAFVPAGTKIARDVYGARGWVLGLRTDAFAGAVIGGSKSIMTWTFGSGWLCRHLMERYHYSGDVEFLRNRAYPLMKGAAQFYLDTLVEAPQGTSVAGKLVMFPSNSPENTFIDRDGKKGHVTYGSAMDTQIMLELFQNCLESQQILKMDSAEELAFKRELEQAMAKLQPYQISQTDGRLLEWPEEFKEQHSGHRHLSHLYALYPGDTINASTPKLLEAARKSLEVRTSGGGGGTGWSEGWVAPLWARLGDGDRAAFAYDRMLGTLMNNNMFNQCPSSKGAQRYPEYWWEGLDYVMQVEGNLAVSGGLPELLVQSHLRNPDGSFLIDLLPALPDGWPTGSVTGLRVRGGFEMDIEWAAGKLKQATVSCISGGTGTLRYGDTVVKLDMQPGQTLSVDADLKL